MAGGVGAWRDGWLGANGCKWLQIAGRGGDGLLEATLLARRCLAARLKPGHYGIGGLDGLDELDGQVIVTSGVAGSSLRGQDVEGYDQTGPATGTQKRFTAGWERASCHWAAPAPGSYLTNAPIFLQNF